jgi:hypothetical protein
MMEDGCTGTALVFSGRPDPEWPVSAGARDELVAIWAALTRDAPAPAPVPALGYRGCALRCPRDEEWLASGGVVTHTAVSGAVERRSDPERSFERLLLSTAPRGAVPPGCLDGI